MSMMAPGRPLRVGWLIVVALACATTVLGEGYPYAELEQWIIDHGGSIDTTIATNHEGVRGLFTKIDAEAGQTVATIPSACMINAGSLESNIVLGTLIVLRELLDPHSRFKPYMKVWPGRDEIMNVCNFKEKYLPLLDSAYWEKTVHLTQNYLTAALSGEINHDLEYTVQEMVGNTTVTEADMQYACAVASTRYVTEEKRKRLLMIPIFDMENHRRDCVHTTSALNDGNTISIIMGEDVKAGDEICYAYTDTMRDDYAVMNYGFLPDAEDPPRLLEIDHHDFKEDSDTQNLSETPFDGEEHELEAEIKRQQETLDKLLALDVARPEGPAPGTDWTYDTLVALQKRRREALRYEIERLKKELADMAME